MTLEQHTLTITQDQINRGIRGNAAYCPVALCINEYFQERKITAYADIRFPSIALTFGAGTQVLYLDTLPIIHDFMKKFDRGDMVEPITFPMAFDTNLAISYAKTIVLGVLERSTIFK